MPAYRSEAEAEIRGAVVAKLRHYRPGARIMHEVNICNGSNRVDLIAVDAAEIIMVEIKSERDKLDRLADQCDAMLRSAHHVIVALHRKFMPDVDGLSRQRVDGVPWSIDHWWYPGAQDMAEAHHPAFCWAEPRLEQSLQRPLPEEALDILWREELASLCRDIGVSVPPRANMGQMRRALRWGCTGRDLTYGICRALRARSLCAEADAPIQDAGPSRTSLFAAAQEGTA